VTAGGNVSCAPRSSVPAPRKTDNPWAVISVIALKTIQSMGHGSDCYSGTFSKCAERTTHPRDGWIDRCRLGSVFQGFTDANQISFNDNRPVSPCFRLIHCCFRYNRVGLTVSYVNTPPHPGTFTERRSDELDNFSRPKGDYFSQIPNILAAIRPIPFLELNTVINNTCTLNIHVLSSLLFGLDRGPSRQPH
jgi:hypothetical protein